VPTQIVRAIAITYTGRSLDSVCTFKLNRSASNDWSMRWSGPMVPGTSRISVGDLATMSNLSEPVHEGPPTSLEWLKLICGPNQRIQRHIRECQSPAR